MFAFGVDAVNPMLCGIGPAYMVPAAAKPTDFGTRTYVVDIFDEVDEDVRRERMHAAAKRYGPLIGGGVAVIIAVVAGVTFYRQYQADARAEAGAAFLAATRAQQETPSAGQSAFAQLAEAGPAGYPLLARLKEAEALTQKGDRQGAIAALNGVEDLDAPQRYKDLARLMALSLRSYEEPPETLLPLVEPLAAAGSPWRVFAQEQAAMLEWKLGRMDAARTRLEAISADAEAPVGIRARADAALSAMPKG